MARSWAPDRRRVSRSNASGKKRALEAGCQLDEHLGTDEIVDKLAKRAFAWSGYRCYLCGVAVTSNEEWHLDHLHPLAAGGAHILKNLEMACVRCNLFKSDLPIHEFLTQAGWSALKPLFEHLRLSDRPVEELWAENPKVATRFARRPREVPATKGWSLQGHEVERALVAALIDGRDENMLWNARSIRELRLDPSTPAGGALDDNYWRALMGLLPQFGDERRVPSRWIVPVRIGRGVSGVPGERGFRLRFVVPPEAARAFALNELFGEPPAPAALRDADEL